MLPAILFALLGSMATLPNAHAAKGTVKVNFPPNTFTGVPEGDPNQPSFLKGGHRNFPFDAAGSTDFIWNGPMWKNFDDDDDDASKTVTTIPGSNPSKTTVATSSSSPAATGDPAQLKFEGYAWNQVCKVSVDDKFDQDVEFTLRAEKEGFKGPRDQHASIVCSLPGCLLPKGSECEGELVIPIVDSTPV